MPIKVYKQIHTDNILYLNIFEYSKQGKYVHNLYNEKIFAKNVMTNLCRGLSFITIRKPHSLIDIYWEALTGLERFLLFI